MPAPSTLTILSVLAPAVALVGAAPILHTRNVQIEAFTSALIGVATAGQVNGVAGISGSFDVGADVDPTTANKRTRALDAAVLNTCNAKYTSANDECAAISAYVAASWFAYQQGMSGADFFAAIGSSRVQKMETVISDFCSQDSSSTWCTPTNQGYTLYSNNMATVNAATYVSSYSQVGLLDLIDGATANVKRDFFDSNPVNLLSALPGTNGAIASIKNAEALASGMMGNTAKNDDIAGMNLGALTGGLKRQIGVGADAAANIDVNADAALGLNIKRQFGVGAAAAADIDINADASLGLDIKRQVGTGVGAGLAADVDVNLDEGLDIAAKRQIGAGADLAADVHINADADLSASLRRREIGVGADVSADIELNADANLGVAARSPQVDLGVDADIELNVDADADAGVYARDERRSRSGHPRPHKRVTYSAGGFNTTITPTGGGYEVDIESAQVNVTSEAVPGGVAYGIQLPNSTLGNGSPASDAALQSLGLEKKRTQLEELETLRQNDASTEIGGAAMDGQAGNGISSNGYNYISTSGNGAASSSTGVNDLPVINQDTKRQLDLLQDLPVEGLLGGLKKRQLDLLQDLPVEGLLGGLKKRQLDLLQDLPVEGLLGGLKKRQLDLLQDLPVEGLLGGLKKRQLDLLQELPLEDVLGGLKRQGNLLEDLPIEGLLGGLKKKSPEPISALGLRRRHEKNLSRSRARRQLGDLLPQAEEMIYKGALMG